MPRNSDTEVRSPGRLFFLELVVTCLGIHVEGNRRLGSRFSVPLWREREETFPGRRVGPTVDLSLPESEGSDMVRYCLPGRH